MINKTHSWWQRWYMMITINHYYTLCKSISTRSSSIFSPSQCATKVLPWCRGGLWRRRGVSADGRYAAIDRAHHYTGAVEKLWSFTGDWDPGDSSRDLFGIVKLLSDPFEGLSDLQRLGIKRSLWITWIWFFPLFFLNLGLIFSSGNFLQLDFFLNLVGFLVGGC